MVNAALSALLNLLLLAGIPFLVYFVYHKRRHKRSFKEIRQRAGLRLGQRQYTLYCLTFAIVVVAVLILWPPPLESSLRAGSGFRAFNGLGLGTQSLVMALFYGVIKTGFAEEFLFRGLIAGSLSRRLSMLWANLVQALVFLVPHLFVLFIMPEIWGILPVILVGSLFVGWVRIKSGSIVGPWLVHASVNVTVALSVAIRTSM